MMMVKLSQSQYPYSLGMLYSTHHGSDRIDDAANKPQDPINKLKEAEFWYMLEGKFYGGAELVKKSKIRQNCWANNQNSI